MQSWLKSCFIFLQDYSYHYVLISQVDYTVDPDLRSQLIWIHTVFNTGYNRALYHGIWNCNLCLLKKKKGLCMLCRHLLTFFKTNFKKNDFRSTITVSNGLDSSILIWVHTVCKRYEQMTKEAASMERDYASNWMEDFIS